MSQPAVTQSLNKLEAEAGGPLFDRTRQGFFLTQRGQLLDARLRRAMNRLDVALAEVSPRLIVTATSAQLQALIAMTTAQNFSVAARNLGLAQPTVHRAVTQIEQEAARALFERTSFGMVATRQCLRLAQAARLALSEFEQAETELAALDGRDAGSIVIGALPMSRSVVLPEALARFHTDRSGQRITVIDGPYGEMLVSLRNGSLDFIIGALRDPPPADDVVQEPLFDDRLVIVARPGHPLAQVSHIPMDDLVSHAWAVPRPGTPSREQFDALFGEKGLPMPARIIEVGSILLMRELLARCDMLGCISGRQAAAEIDRGLLVRLDTGIIWPPRAIGLTYRARWVPTAAQESLIGHLRAVAVAGTVQSSEANYSLN